MVFLAVGRWKNPFNRSDVPKKLGIEIQQEANGVTYTQAHGGHTLFKIHASKVVQLKKGNALLHDVMIELYGADGSRVDRIEGAEFEYDQKAGTAKAAGSVEITLMRPGVAPAIAPKAATGQVVSEKRKGAPVATVAETAARGEIHVKTSGLTFDQKSGVATTSQRVDFSMVQGAGSSMGATFDSGSGAAGAGSCGGAFSAARRGDDSDSRAARGVRAGEPALPDARGDGELPGRTGDGGRGEDSLPRGWIGGAAGCDEWIHADDGDGFALGSADRADGFQRAESAAPRAP